MDTKVSVTRIQLDDDWNIILPEGYKIIKEYDPKDIIINRIAQIEDELKQLSEPTESELIKEGKITHPYYMLIEELEILRGV